MDPLRVEQRATLKYKLVTMENKISNLAAVVAGEEWFGSSSAGNHMPFEI